LDNSNCQQRIKYNITIDQKIKCRHPHLEPAFLFAAHTLIKIQEKDCTNLIVTSRQQCDFYKERIEENISGIFTQNLATDRYQEELRRRMFICQEELCWI